MINIYPLQARLPFMEPKHRMGDEAHRLKRCYSRVKCFIGELLAIKIHIYEIEIIYTCSY